MSKLIPFGLMPGHWGLKGKTRARAQAEYELEGLDLDLKLVELDYPDPIEREVKQWETQFRYGKIDELEKDTKIAQAKFKEQPDQLEVELTKIELHHNKITPLEYDRKVAHFKFAKDSKDLERELVEIEFKHHQIERPEYERKLADIAQEPWVAMPELSWDPADPSRSFFRLDYNDHFVEFLRINGYQGTTEEIIVEGWLNDICRSVITDMAQDDPNFLSANTAPSVKRTPRKVKKNQKPRAEYS